MTLQVTKHRFTVDEYDLMGTAGIFGEDDRVELIDGEIIEMSPIGHRHAAKVDRFIPLFASRLGAAAQIRIQNPIKLGVNSEPQPDLTLLRPRSDFYASGHPTPADVLLVVEVADSSLEFDREIKGELYARAGIPEFWLENVEQDTITVYREPAPAGYRVSWVARRGDYLSPLAFPEVRIAVSDIIGGSSPVSAHA